jgi:pimeloyl-ACP methyl ester carboxylesterase
MKQRYSGPEQMLAIMCGDTITPPASAFPGLQGQVLRQGGRISLPDLWGDEPCSTWPVREMDTYRGPWNAPTKPILVIGNTTDPSTPLHNSEVMTRELANARLLVVRQPGHTELLNPDACEPLRDALLPDNVWLASAGARRGGAVSGIPGHGEACTVAAASDGA